jgi:hypothetical protein
VSCLTPYRAPTIHVDRRLEIGPVPPFAEFSSCTTAPTQTPLQGKLWEVRFLSQALVPSRTGLFAYLVQGPVDAGPVAKPIVHPVPPLAPPS